MTKQYFLIVIGLLLAFTSLTWAEDGPTGTQPFPQDMCPMMVADVSVSYAKTEDGAALVFKTEAENVENLQARVEHMAIMYNNHDEYGHMGMGPMMMQGRGMQGGMMGGQKGNRMQGKTSEPGMMGHGQGKQGQGMHGQGRQGQGMKPCMQGQQGKSSCPMMTSNAKVEKTDNGARLILTPKDDGNLDALRKHAQWMAEHMTKGTCPRMKMMGMMGGPKPVNSPESGDESTGADDHSQHH